MKSNRVIAAITLAMLSAFARSLADSPKRALYARSHPTSIAWGQIEVRVGPSLEVANGPNGERARYPYSVSVALTTHTRVARAGEQASSSSEPIGTAYLAIEVETGKAWTTFRDDLLAGLGRLPNSAYNQWLENLAGQLDVSKTVGSYRFAYCIARANGPSTAGEAHRIESEDESSAGSSTSRDPKLACDSLRAAFSSGPPDHLVTSEFAVASSIEERVELAADVRQLDASPSPLPLGAKIERDAAPAGATDYSTGGRSGRRFTGEELRHPAKSSDKTAAPDYVLRSEAAPAIVSKQSLNGALQMWRFNLSKTERQFGVSPQDRVGEEFVDIALFFAGPPRPVDAEAVFAAAADALQRDERSLSGEVLQAKLQESLRVLGPEDAFTVFCVPQWLRDDNAIYCAALTCSDVQNAREICKAIQARLDS